jgi:TonB-dependent starch-binding outer membrane protein SusC
MQFTALCKQVAIPVFGCRSVTGRALRQTMCVMKLSILMFVFCLQVNANGVSQTITFSGKNVSLETIFLEIKKQTGYVVVCNYQILQQSKPVSVSAKNEPLEIFVTNVLKHQQLNFVIKDKSIFIARENKAVFKTVPSIVADTSGIAENVVRGIVKSSEGQPLSGATVKIQESQKMVMTDQQGSFSIEAETGNLLVISYVGYQTKQIKIGTVEFYTVALAPTENPLNEIVVTGYATEKKKDIIGSVAVVDMSALKKIPAGSAIQALQGQAAGVNVISSGAPGGTSNIFIRGISSFGNTQPLIIVDGVQTDLNNISSDDIESMQILKDAGAAAIYGVRGANGVIVVTTRKGKANQTNITYDAYYGIQLPLRGNPFNLMNSEDFIKTFQIAYPNSTTFKNGLQDYFYLSPSGTGMAMEGDPIVDPSHYNLDPANFGNNYLIQKVSKPGTNWFQEIFSPAPITNHALTVSGGTDKARYLFSLGYFNQEGTMMSTEYKRYSARINTEFNLNKNIRIGQNAYVFYKQNPSYFQNLARWNVMMELPLIVPLVPVYDIAGNYGQSFIGPGELGWSNNPVWELNSTKNNRNNAWDVIGNVYAEANFLKHFTARTSFGGTIDNKYTLSFMGNEYFPPNSLSEGASYNSNYIWTNTINYKNEFGKHNFKIIAGSEAIRNYGRAISGSTQGLFSNDFDYLSLSNGTTNISNYSSAYENKLFSLFSRLDYTYDDKYLLGLTIRRDGSSKFGADKRYGVFPSVSAGWRISNEPFMKNIQWLNDLRLRGSYGILGSEINVNPANAFTVYGGGPGTAYYDIRGTSNSIQQGFYAMRLGNPNTSWEENVISNIGIDATLFNKMDLSLEYFQKSINGLAFPQPLPASVGDASPPTINIGDIQNKGFDIAAGYRGRISNDFQFSLKSNITTYKNLVVSIPDPGYFAAMWTPALDFLVRNQEGQPVSSFWGYKVDGLFRDDAEVAASPEQPEAAPGRFKYKDVNGDKIITPEDRTFIGNPNPDFTYGINLGLNYKNFDLSAIFYGSQGGDVVNYLRIYTDFYGSYQSAKSNVLLNAWTPDNTNTTIPKIESLTSFSSTDVFNSYYIEDGSYFRLRTVVLGYNFSQPLLQRMHMKKLRLYFQGTNLFTFTKYSGLDPELGGSSSSFGIDQGNYPNNQHNFLLGLNVSF